jgi:hypothetical protein
MKSAISCLIVIAALLLISSCSPSSLDAISYIKWVEDEENELKVSKEIDGFSFSLQYKPVPYIILMENGGVCPADGKYNERKEELGGMQYYTLRISSDKDQDLLKAGVRNDNDYYSRLEYFTSVMQDDIKLVDGSDTIACALYHYERNYNLSPYTNVMLGFENGLQEKKGAERTLILNDQVLGIGTIKLSIQEENIANMPELNKVP